MSDLFTQTNSQTVELELDFLNPKATAKELVAQVDWTITHRKVEYLTQLFELKRHKSVQIRRKVATGIGILGKQESLFELKKWLVMEPDRTTWLILESTIDKLERGFLGQDLEKNVSVLSVSEAINQIKRLVSEKTYIIEGELSEVKAVKQMYYFALKDKQDSRIDCWGFVGKIARSGFALNEGLSVRVTGKFKLSKYSKIYFDIDKIELTGQGQLLRNLKVLEEKLTQEGLFDPLRKRKLRKIPDNILLIASPNSAAISDFLQVLKNRRTGIKVYFLPIKTQGMGAEIEILETLELANKIISFDSETNPQKTSNPNKIVIDTIVMTRGGGSKDDLFVFNSERVVRAVHSLKKPIIVAIGHERDLTLAELAADLRASTPSQAAELVSTSKNEILGQTHLVYSFCQNFFYEKRKNYLVYTNSVWYNISNRIQARIKFYKNVCTMTDKLLTNFLFKTNSRIAAIWQQIFASSYNKVYQLKASLNQIDYLQIQLLATTKNYQKETKQIFARILANANQKLQKSKTEVEYLGKNLELYDPKNVLKKGYAIVKQDQEIIFRKDLYKNNSNLVLEFFDGEIEITPKPL